MSTYSYLFDLTPRPQARPRATIVTRPDGRTTARVYKAPAAEDAERDLFYLAATEPGKPPTPLTGPLRIWISASFPRPKSVPAKTRKEHVVKPDLDNCVKFMLDVLTRAGYWKDDKQIISIYAFKKYTDDDSSNGYWNVEITEQED